MTADQWTHHDPAVRELIRRAQADAWEEATDYDTARAVVLACEDAGVDRPRNPYRDEGTR